jgi:glutaredoxin
LHGIALGDDGRCAICRRQRDDVPEEPNTPWRALVFFALLTVIALGSYVLIRQQRLATSPPTADTTPPWRRPVSREPAVPQPVEPPAATSERPNVVERRKQYLEKLAEREELIELEMKRIPITMYVEPDCDDCKRAKKWFEENGYAVTERDITSDGRYLRARDRLNPKKTVPTLQVGGKVLGGFDEAKVKGELHAQAEALLD